MLCDVLGVVIARWQVLLEIVLDVVLDVKPVDHFQDAVRVLLPIRCGGLRQVVGASNLVEVNEFMRALDDRQTACRVECRFQANPGENASVMKPFERGNSVIWQSCATFPFAAERVVQARQRAGKRVAFGPEEIEVAQGALPAFGQGADRQPVFLQSQQHVTRERVIARVVGVSGEGQHDLLGNAAGTIFVRVFAKRRQEIVAFVCTCVEFLARNLEDFGHIAVRALVAAATIRIGGEFGVFACLPAWRVDNGATSYAPAIGIDGVGSAVHGNAFLWNL